MANFRPSPIRIAGKLFPRPMRRPDGTLADRQPLVPGLVVAVNPPATANRNRIFRVASGDTALLEQVRQIARGRLPDAETEGYMLGYSHLSAERYGLDGAPTGYALRWPNPGRNIVNTHGRRTLITLIRPLAEGSDVWIGKAHDKVFAPLYWPFTAHGTGSRINRDAPVDTQRAVSVARECLEAGGTAGVHAARAMFGANNARDRYLLLRKSDIEFILDPGAFDPDERRLMTSLLETGGWAHATPGDAMFARLGRLCSEGRTDRRGSMSARDRREVRTQCLQASDRLRARVREAASGFAVWGMCDYVRDRLNMAARNFTPHLGGGRTAEAIVVRMFDKAIGRPSGLVRADCGHLEVASDIRRLRTSIATSATTSVCASCDHRVGREYMTRGGTTARFHRDYVGGYAWSDGTYRTYDEPSLIGGYHSSKNIVDFVRPTVPAIATPTMGFELEVQRNPSTAKSANTIASEIRKIVDTELGATAGRKYLSMEYDGSVTDGFEMVSGWTYLDMHRHMLGKLLDERDWKRDLRSHSASCSCGLHVHIEMPRSLTHAARLRFMLNSREFEPIIKAVARRYNTNYAKVKGNSAPVGKMVAALLRNFKPWGYGSRDLNWVKSPELVDTAKANLSADRYELLNFNNRKTVEFRLFRGSMIYGTVMACLEFTLACWRYTRDTPASSISVDSFIEFINRPEHAADTRCLRPLLHRKGFTAVRVTKPAPSAAVVADDTTA